MAQSVGSHLPSELLDRFHPDTIGSHADQVVLLSDTKPHASGYQMTVKLDKNRHGPRVEWDIVLDTKTLRMLEPLKSPGVHHSGVA